MSTRRLAFVRRLNRTVLFAITLLIIMTATCIQPSFAATWHKLTGLTQDEPGISLELRSGVYIMHIVVRGLDNKIYYSSVDTSTDVQTSWISVGGLTSSGPAVFFHYYDYYKLTLAVRGLSANGIYWKQWDPSWGQTDWVKMSGSTSSAPDTIRVRLPNTGGPTQFVIVRGMDNGIYWRRAEYYGLYSPWYKLSGATKDSPSFFYDNGYLYVAVRGMDNGIYWSTVNLADNVQSSWHRIAGSTLSGPAIAHYDSTHFTIAVRGGDNRIYYQAVRTTDNYQPGWTIRAGATSSGPAIAYGVDRLFFCVRGMDNGIWWIQIP